VIEPGTSAPGDAVRIAQAPEAAGRLDPRGTHPAIWDIRFITEQPEDE
jgi:hypothetical protein